MFKFVCPAICALALGSMAAAQDFSFAEVSSVQSVGTWAEGDLYGDIRLIVANTGYEKLGLQHYVDWVWQDPDTGIAMVLATRALGDCEAQVLGTGAATIASDQSVFGAKALLVFSTNAARAEFTIGGPGIVSIPNCE